MLVSPRMMKSLEYVLACPQSDSPPKTVLISLQHQEPLERVLFSPPAEEGPGALLVSPLPRRRSCWPPL